MLFVMSCWWAWVTASRVAYVLLAVQLTINCESDQFGLVRGSSLVLTSVSDIIFIEAIQGPIPNEVHK